MKSDGVLLLAILLAGLALRAAYLHERIDHPDFDAPALDAAFHDDQARTLAFGEDRAAEWRRGVPADPAFATTAYLRPPAYPYLLAAIYKIGDGDRRLAIAVQAALGLLAIGLIFAIGRIAGAPDRGLLAAALMATHWAPIFFEGELQATSLFIALELSFALALLRCAAGGGAGWAIAAGAAGGAAALARPNALLLLAVAVIWLVWLSRRGSIASWLRPVTALSLTALAVVGIATVRNARVSGELIPITSTLGINLFLGNRPGATGQIDSDLGELGSFRSCYDYPRVIAALERKLGHELSHGDASRWFERQAAGWMAANPGEFLSISLRKLSLLFGPAELEHNKVVSLERSHSATLRWLPLPFTLLLFFAAFGAFSTAVVASRADREKFVLLLGLAAALALSLLPFFAAARYRVPLLPFLFLLAAQSLRARVSGARQLGAFAAGAAAIALTAQWAAPAYTPSEARFELDRGAAELRRGDLGAARDNLNRALVAAPGWIPARYYLAVVEQAAGEQARARELFAGIVRDESHHFEARLALGLLSWKLGLAEASVAELVEATRIDPSSARAAFEHGTRAPQVGRHQAGLLSLRAALELVPGNRQYRDALAFQLATSPDDALRDGVEALGVLEASGTSPRELRTLAAVYAELGQFERALEVLQAAIARQQEAIAARRERGATTTGLQQNLEQLKHDLALYRSGEPLRSR